MTSSEEAYGVFAAEARDVKPEYPPRRPGRAWPALIGLRATAVVVAATAEEFRRLMNELQQWCGTQTWTASVHEIKSSGGLFPSGMPSHEQRGGPSHEPAVPSRRVDKEPGGGQLHRHRRGRSAALGNGTNGVLLDAAAGNTVGGTGTAANTIGGNVTGIYILGSGVTGNVVLGNFIGTDVSGANLGNVNGQHLITTTPNNTIGGANTIGRNGSGIIILGSAHTGNVVLGDYIGTDASGDNLGNGGDGVLISRSRRTTRSAGPTPSVTMAAGASRLMIQSPPATWCWATTSAPTPAVTIWATAATGSTSATRRTTRSAGPGMQLAYVA